MSNKIHVSFRIKKSTIEKIDMVRDVALKQSGFLPTRTQVIEGLLSQQLDKNGGKS